LSLLVSSRFLFLYDIQPPHRIYPPTSKDDLDELSHTIFLMLQETNKYREHQSREVLIELLEDQLQARIQLVEELEIQTNAATSLLSMEETTT
jgi:MED7 protein